MLMRRTALFLFTTLHFLTANAQTKLPPLLEWQKSLGGSRSDKAYTIINTIDDGFLIVGESFSNDGQVTGHHGSTDSSDAWVVKLDADGNLLWQRSYGGNRNDRLVDALALPGGDFMVVGRSESDNGDVSGLHKSGTGAYNADLWIMRISSTGDIRWSRLYGGTQTDEAVVIEKHPAGGFIIGGNTSSNDFDVTVNNGASDIWLLRIDVNGVIQWQRTYGNTSPNFCTALTPVSGGRFAISGYTTPPASLPPGCQVIYAEYSALSIMVQTTGFIIWQNIPAIPCGNPGRSDFYAKLLEMPSGMLTAIGNMYNTSLQSFAGLTLTNIDPSTGSIRDQSYDQFNYVTYAREPGPRRNLLLPDSSILHCGSMILYNESNVNGVVIRFNTSDLRADNFYYRKSIGGNNNESLNSIAMINELSYVTAGFSNSNNGDVSGNNGDYDCWIVKLSSHNAITGNVFIDKNQNGSKDPGESAAGGFMIETSRNGQTLSGITDSNGVFRNMVDTGTYSTTVLLQQPYYTITPINRSSSFSAFNQQDSFHFALAPLAGKKDLRVALQSTSPLRPGFDAHYRIDYANQGTEHIPDAVIRFIKPTHTDFISATPAATTVTADTIIWNIGSIQMPGKGTITFTLKADPPPGVNIGDKLAFITTILPVLDDETPADNRDTVYQTVTGAYDPNDKVEKYDGMVYMEHLDAFDNFRYTIRFQNTGNDTAFTVVVRDTLSGKLQGNTFEMIGASHPYTLVITDNQYITWTFRQILLVDSNTNEPLSHGMITYRIQPAQPLQLNDTVSNRASIYFDFNPPVQTNTQLTVVKFHPPVIPEVSGLLSVYCDTVSQQIGKISNLPAAGNTLATVTLDSQSIAIAGDSTFAFLIDTLATGAHTITVTYSNPSHTISFTHPFNVVATVQPEVNLTANITTISHLNAPVIITATNVAGGGTAPYYTFSLKRDFSMPLAEGNGNVISITPGTFAVGDNWVYVKMRSNATCITTDTNSDSIKVVRDLSTGITDPDNPGRMITFYPNPVYRELQINGLNALKTYRLQIADLQGRLVQQQMVINSSSASVTLNTQPRGLYLLTIYDVRIGRELGTVKLVKQ